MSTLKFPKPASNLESFGRHALLRARGLIAAAVMMGCSPLDDAVVNELEARLDAGVADVRPSTDAPSDRSDAANPSDVVMNDGGVDVSTDNPVQVDVPMGGDASDVVMMAEVGPDAADVVIAPDRVVPTDSGDASDASDASVRDVVPSGCVFRSIEVNGGRLINLTVPLGNVSVRLGLSGDCSSLNAVDLPVQMSAGAVTDNLRRLSMGAVTSATTEVNTAIDLSMFDNLDGVPVHVTVPYRGSLSISADPVVYSLAPRVAIRFGASIPRFGEYSANVTASVPMDCTLRFMNTGGSAPWFSQGDNSACSAYMAGCPSFMAGMSSFPQSCGVALAGNMSPASYTCNIGVYNRRLTMGDSTVNVAMPTGDSTVRPTFGSSGQIRLSCIDQRSGNRASASTVISAD